VLISDFLTLPGSRDFAYPLSLVEEIEGKFGKYPLHFSTVLYSANSSVRVAETLLRELHHELKYKFNIGHYLLDNMKAILQFYTFPEYIVFNMSHGISWIQIIQSMIK
jgi:hypothetical protein